MGWFYLHHQLFLLPSLYSYRMIMFRCWKVDSDKRPTFKQLVSDIGTALHYMADYLELNEMEAVRTLSATLSRYTTSLHQWWNWNQSRLLLFFKSAPPKIYMYIFGDIFLGMCACVKLYFYAFYPHVVYTTTYTSTCTCIHVCSTWLHIFLFFIYNRFTVRKWHDSWWWVMTKCSWGQGHPVVPVSTTRTPIQIVCNRVICLFTYIETLITTSRTCR